MGGPGSGPRWWRGSKKTTVEECLTIKAEDFKDIIRRGGTGSYQSMFWGKSNMAFYVEDEEEAGRRPLRMKYRRGEGDNARELDYHVRMVKTVPHFGGVRWFFLCPLVHHGRPCLHRVSKLYLPPGGLYFGCRKCYDLTYTSSQESHKFDGLFKALAADMGRGFTPAQVKAALTRK